MVYAKYTEVPFSRSLAQITDMLRKAGAERIMQGEDGDMFAVQFNLGDRMIRFRIRLCDPRSNRKPDVIKRERARSLLLVLKAKLESIESAIETIDEAFLANVVMSDGQTVYERIAEGLALEYQTGRPDAAYGLLPPPQGSA